MNDLLDLVNYEIVDFSGNSGPFGTSPEKGMNSVML